MKIRTQSKSNVEGKTKDQEKKRNKRSRRRKQPRREEELLIRFESLFSEIVI